MARSVEAMGRVDPAGNLFVTNNQHIGQWLLAHKDKQIRLTIEVFGKKRSNPLNRYYRGVVVPMVRKALLEFGNEMDNDDTHEFLKARFNYKEIVLPDGVVEQVPVSTTKCDNIGFVDYLFKIQKFAAEELYTAIPDPDPDYESKFF